ncbi:MAG: hypothetical protein AAF662_06130 [Pseudomonadota bacterium]
MVQIRLLITSTLLAVDVAFASQVQVLLLADKDEYAQGEVIYISYETLWLGATDGQMRFSSIALPELEVQHLNKFPVQLNALQVNSELREPSRHERATFAPTMSRLSPTFAINDPSNPTMFLNGSKGYYNFQRPGAYVIRAIFRADTEWRLFKEQRTDVYSTKIVIQIKQE